MFYLNLVGYKVVEYVNDISMPSRFYLNLVGYKDAMVQGLAAIQTVLSELSGI